VIYTTNRAVNRQITVQGKNFTAGTKVYIDNKLATVTTYKSSTKLVAQFKVFNLKKGKSYVVTVRNVDGQTATAKSLIGVR